MTRITVVFHKDFENGVNKFLHRVAEFN